MVSKVKFTYLWKLDDEKLPETSPDFKCTFENIGYSFALSKQYIEGEEETFILLKYVDGSKESIKVDYRFELIDYDLDDEERCNHCDKVQRIEVFEKNKVNDDDKETGIRYTFQKNHQSLLDDDSYRASIRCIIFIELDNFFIKICPPKLETPMLYASQLFTSALTDSGQSYCSDVVLKSNEDQCFRCHKNIFIVNSTAFEKMFTSTASDESESKDSILKLDDVNSVVLKEVIRFVYTGQVGENVEEIVLDLIKAAVKFKLNKLIEYCSWLMFDKVKKENALEFLIVADELKMDDVREKSVSVISQYEFSLRTTDEWITFKKLYPHLIVDILDDSVDRMGVLVKPV